jgi:Zn finger protein HypA/HybF involved in hydrogenase expression
MQTEEMRLDGNAAAGMLRELFVADVTSAVVTCRACGEIGPVGRLLEYGHAMGVILRCPTCESVMLRVVHGPDALRLDASGIALMVISTNAVVS